MNADGVMRALDQQGEWVIFRRLTGPQRIPFDVKCRAYVQSGITRQAEVLVGAVQQTLDRITVTSREMIAKRWPLPPRHGDLVIYEDGRSTSVQGRADSNTLDNDTVFFVHVQGG